MKRTAASRFVIQNLSKINKKYLKLVGFVRTRGFSHEFSKLLLQLIFRWGDDGTNEGMGLLAIYIERIKGGR